MDLGFLLMLIRTKSCKKHCKHGRVCAFWGKGAVAMERLTLQWKGVGEGNISV